MQQLARDEAGNVWQVDAAGNPVALVQPAGGGPQPMTIGAPDPAAAFEAPKAAVDLQRARLDAQRAAATAPYDAAKAAADARTAAANATKAERDVQAQQATANPQQQRAMAALGNDEILSAIMKARSDLGRSGSAGFAARLPEFAQPQAAIDLAGSLNTIASRLTLDKLAQMKASSPTGASGLGSLTEREGALLRDSVAGLGQTQSPERLLENLAAVEKHYRNYMALAAGEDYRDPRVAAKYGIAALPGKQDEAVGLTKGKTREEDDPALAGVNSRIRSLIGSGAPTAEIVSYMNSVRPGLGDGKRADVDAAVKFRAQNPTVPLSRYPISVERREVPMTGTQQFMNSAAQSPLGAYAVAAGDAISLGTLDNSFDNPALARAGMSAVQDANPISSTLGTLSGGALGAAGGEFAAARFGAGAAAPLIGDALYGAAYGAGSADDGSRLTGALTGGGVGALGGAIGRRVATAGGAALQGVRDQSVRYLRDAGVPMTLGQMVGSSGSVGRFIKGREDRLAGFSGIGDTINARRRTGLEAFNRAAYDEALAPINRTGLGMTGEEAVEGAGTAVSAAYANALDGINLTPDAQFAAQMAPVGFRAANLPGERAGQALYTLNERVGASMVPQGPIVGQNGATAINTGATMSGRNFQQSVRGLERDARAMRNETYGNDFGNVARDARGALEGLLDRQAPGALPDYLNANAAYRNHAILADATAAGMNADGLFTPAQLGAAARQNARTFTGRISAATTDRPFYDLQRAGQQVLPSKVPDSGTAGRIEAGGGVLGLARGAARSLVNGPAYAEALQPSLGRLFLDRPDVAVRFGERLANQRRLLGMFGAPIALNYGPTAPTY